jgi:hypothetical protein
MEPEPARGRLCIDPFLEADEADSERLQVVQQAYQVLKSARAIGLQPVSCPRFLLCRPTDEAGAPVADSPETRDGGCLLNPLTFDAAVDDFPLWSPDGRSIVFTSNRKGAFDLYRKSTTGEGGDELLMSAANFKSACDGSRDGRFLLFRMTSPETGYDLWALPLGGDSKPIPLARTNAEERDGQFSPNGRWVAYQSNESGRFEIYVQPFPGPGNKSRISTNGGAQVRWRPDSKELFYVALDGQLTAVPIRLDSNTQTVETGSPAALFRTRATGGAVRGVNRQQYVVSPDGERFLCNRAADLTYLPANGD